jgi:hypothetical protein
LTHRADLRVIKSRHKVGGDFSRLLFVYGLRDILTVLNSQQEDADEKAGHERPEAEKQGEGVGFLSGVGPTVVGGTGGFMAVGSVMPLESGEMGGVEQLVSGSLARLGAVGLRRGRL